MTIVILPIGFLCLALAFSGDLLYIFNVDRGAVKIVFKA